MKRKTAIEHNIELVNTVRMIAKRDNDIELLQWANGIRQALEWIIDNTDNSDIGIAKCNSAQELEVIQEMGKMDWCEPRP